MDQDLAPSSADDLIAGVRDRDPGAFAALYDRTAPMLLAVIARLVTNRDRAESILQDVFVSVWHHAPSFDRSRTRALTWLTMLARQAAIEAVTLDRRLRAVAGAPAVSVGELAALDGAGAPAAVADAGDEPVEPAHADGDGPAEPPATDAAQTLAADARLPLPQRAAERRARDAMRSAAAANDPLERLLASRAQGGQPAGDDEALRLGDTLRGVDQLTRRCVSLTFFDGLRPAEIAPQVGETPGAVRGRIRQAIARIRYSLAGADALARR